MRISDHRYSRDRFRLDLAMRFIRHEARTQTIRAWTGLSDDRIRKLYRSYSNDPGTAVSRPRGKSPQQCTFFTRTPQHSEESSLLASLCSLLGALPRTGAPVNQQTLANLSRGELLCQAFEAYHDLVAEPRISFEHLRVSGPRANPRRGADTGQLRRMWCSHRRRAHLLQGAKVPALCGLLRLASRFAR